MRQKEQKTMKKILNKLFMGKNLEETDIKRVLKGIAEETFSKEQISAFLGALSAKRYGCFLNKHGATPKETAFFAKHLRSYSKCTELKSNTGFVDVCGTGGDCLNTFNISTTTAFVTAGGGAKIVKHGNRSVSSNCGSADVLEALGIKPAFEKENLQNILDNTGMIFLYAPQFNTCLGKIKQIRNSIGAPTVFNLMGPLINPVKLDYQVIGVYDESKCEPLAEALIHLGLKEAMVVHGKDGLDELSTTCKNVIYHVKNKKVKKIKLPSLKELGLKKAKLDDIRGGTPNENAEIILKILHGEKGAPRDIVLLNSAAAFVVCGIADDFKSGVKIAAKSIDSGAALNVLEKLKNVS